MDKKPLFNVDTKEIIDLIAKARSEQEIQKLLMEMSNNHQDMQRVNGHALGSLIEKRFGADDITSSNSLNAYLKKMVDKDYPDLDKVRELIYSEVKPLEASYQKGVFGNGEYYPNPTIEKPIRLGNTAIGEEFSPQRARAILGHELSHANDMTAIHLRRVKDANPELYEKLVNKIGNLGDGGQKILEHSNNIENKYPTAFADLLTPEKAKILREKLMEEAPSAMREDHINLINKYEDALKKDLGVTYDKSLMQKHIPGIDAKKIPSMENEAIKFRPDREYVQKVLEKEFDPAAAESIRSSGHHAIRKNIPGDIGHYEGRNISRLSKGMGLLGKAVPVIGTGAAVAAALATPDASAAIGDLLIPGGLESAGPSQGSDESILENPKASADQRREALIRLRRGE